MVLYEQKDGVAMGSPLGPILAYPFLCFYEKKMPSWIYASFYGKYIDVFILFKSTDHLKKMCNYFNTCQPNMSFSYEEEKNGKILFLDVEIS